MGRQLSLCSLCTEYSLDLFKAVVREVKTEWRTWAPRSSWNRNNLWDGMITDRDHLIGESSREVFEEREPRQVLQLSSKPPTSFTVGSKCVPPAPLCYQPCYYHERGHSWVEWIPGKRKESHNFIKFLYIQKTKLSINNASDSELGRNCPYFIVIIIEKIDSERMKCRSFGVYGLFLSFLSFISGFIISAERLVSP